MTLTAYPPPPVNTNAAHLRYLDGLRGLAALYVVLHHAYMEVVGARVPESLPIGVKVGTYWLGWGQTAVDVFIVLSGYCLMLPVARSGGELKGGFFGYMGRRARRILPPYYAALILSLLIIKFVPGMNALHGLRWDTALPALKASVVGVHLLLLHTLRPWWAYAIDPPMWSVAVEWHIYFLFPLLLLPLWRRFGIAATVGAAFFVGLLPLMVNKNAYFQSPWFLGLFALGMAGAGLNFGPAQTRLSSATIAGLVRRSAWLSGLGAACFATVTVLAPPVFTRYSYVMDALVGVTTALLLVFCTNVIERGTGARPPVLRVLESKAAVRLGAFSYSLYLVHFPILSLFHLALLPLNLSPTALLLVLETAGTGLCLLLAYGFHVCFERRFMPLSPRNERAAETAAIVSPVP